MPRQLHRPRVRGFTFIECVLTVVIVSLGLLVSVGALERGAGGQSTGQ